MQASLQALQGCFAHRLSPSWVNETRAQLAQHARKSEPARRHKLSVGMVVVSPIHTSVNLSSAYLGSAVLADSAAAPAGRAGPGAKGASVIVNPQHRTMVQGEIVVCRDGAKVGSSQHDRTRLCPLTRKRASFLTPVALAFRHFHKEIKPTHYHRVGLMKE
jgi:hypothetical protein